MGDRKSETGHISQQIGRVSTSKAMLTTILLKIGSVILVEAAFTY
jgi:hypothetical protein